MHYFTKEWYELEVSAHLELEEDKQAEFMSEEYFQELYKQKSEEFLKELQIVHEEIALKHQTLKEGHIKHEPFNREKVAENFYQSFLDNQNRLKKTLTIIFDNSGSFTTITKMNLDNYEIIRQDSLLQNLLWVNDEIYKTNGKYELHVMLRNVNNELIEFIVSAEHISFEH
ncbi:DUF4085 family protein [Desulfosporosinus youngiae]|uniref:DUF4085 family protein n=1 Tax=Desulfosporosinus youngiae DSM 17734 TaxID=768710 RepID=H5Y4K3_9FIRM|nr:DUF4085 family protein [Desulfosporosinus youngiae]EHQ89601.1 hypothetical protein DesyoDRAFT_2534 [Desulfosporosinus youngiae DSM 17734]